MLGSVVLQHIVADRTKELSSVTLTSHPRGQISDTLVSGSSSISVVEETIAVTNLFNGVDYYSLSTQDSVGSIKAEITDNCPTSIVFDRCGFIAFGGSSGVVQVARLSPPAVVQTLEVEGACFVSRSQANLNPISCRRCSCTGSRALHSYGVLECSLRLFVQAYTSESEGRCLLAAGTAERGRDTIIKVWQAKHDNNVGLGLLRRVGTSVLANCHYLMGLV